MTRLLQLRRNAGLAGVLRIAVATPILGYGIWLSVAEWGPTASAAPAVAMVVPWLLRDMLIDGLPRSAVLLRWHVRGLGASAMMLGVAANLLGSMVDDSDLSGWTVGTALAAVALYLSAFVCLYSDARVQLIRQT